MRQRQLPVAALSLGIAVAAGFAPLSAEAAKGDKRVVVLPMTVQGELADHERADIDARIRKALGRGKKVEVLDPAGAIESCVGTECLADIASAAEATHVLRTIVEVDGSDYDIELVISDASGMAVATATDTCDTCGLAEVGSVVTDVTNAVRRKLEAEVTPPPKLVVRSKPAGATVKLDGEAIGTTPLEATVPAGEHDITIEKNGYIVSRQRAAFVDGVRESMNVTLAAVASAQQTTDTSGPPPGRPLRIAGWTTAGLGLGAVGAGIALIVIDGKEITSDCDADNVDLDGDCRWRYGTMTGGAVAAGVGAAALAAGITLAVIGHKKGRAGKTARVQPTATGLALRF
jgi:hypothetical protein